MVFQGFPKNYLDITMVALSFFCAIIAFSAWYFFNLNEALLSASVVKLIAVRVIII